RSFENAEPIESRSFDELDERLERRIGFTRKSDDERCAQCHSRNAGAQSGHQVLDMRAARFAAHPAQHALLDMLERHVDVTRDLVALRDRLDQLVAPMRWMRVKQPHPKISFYILNVAEQRCERGAT